MQALSTRRSFCRSGLLAGAALLSPARRLLSATSTRTIHLRTDAEIGLVRPELHGHFAEHLGSCIYGGLWVGSDSPIPNIRGHRKEAVEYLKALGIPVLRWPGGCFADDYHWRDGIGPRDKRPRRVNIHWGNYVEDNSFGTHEFIELCRLIGAEPYLAGNVGSGTPQELRDWVEYCNYPSGSTLADERAANGSPEPFRVRYWGIGNENWGCGGQMTPEEYAGHYRRFAVYVRQFGDVRPFLIACGPNRNNTDWTQRFLASMYPGRRFVRMDGYAMHFYSNGRLPATKFTADALREQMATFADLERGILQQRAILDGYDPERRVGLLIDEWGVWDRMVPEEEKTYGRLWQQNTIRCAVAAALGLNVFHRQADKLVMCNIAQTVNVLHALLLAHGDKCIRTPSYYAFELARPHRGQTAIKVDNPDTDPNGLSVSASRKDDTLALTCVNPRHDETFEVSASLSRGRLESASARILHHPDMNAHNSFDNPNVVVPKDHRVELGAAGLRLVLPPLSVVTVLGRLRES